MAELKSPFAFDDVFVRNWRPPWACRSEFVVGGGPSKASGEESVMPDFLPRRDLELAAWTQTMSVRLLDEPDVYHVPADIASEYAALQRSFATAVSRTRNAGTDSSLATRQKDSAHTALIALTRQLSHRLRNDQRVGAAELSLVGLSRRARPRRPGVPTTLPVIQIQKTGEREIKMTVRDSEWSRLAKPPSIIGAEVYEFVGEEPTGDVRAWRYAGTVRRPKTTFTLPSEAAVGERVWFCARWLNRRHERGPMSALVSTYAGVRTIGPMLRSLSEPRHRAA